MEKLGNTIVSNKPRERKKEVVNTVSKLYFNRVSGGVQRELSRK